MLAPLPKLSPHVVLRCRCRSRMFCTSELGRQYFSMSEMRCRVFFQCLNSGAVFFFQCLNSGAAIYFQCLKRGADAIPISTVPGRSFLRIQCLRSGADIFRQCPKPGAVLFPQCQKSGFACFPFLTENRPPRVGGKNQCLKRGAWILFRSKTGGARTTSMSSRRCQPDLVKLSQRRSAGLRPPSGIGNPRRSARILPNDVCDQ
jgi:hypothetical protein